MSTKEDKERIAKVREKLFSPEPMADVILYGKARCKVCIAAKKKLKLLGVPFEIREMKDVVQGIIRDVAALTEYSFQDGRLPIIVIKGVGYSYPAAMKELKGNAVEAAPPPPKKKPGRPIEPGSRRSKRGYYDD